MHAQTFDVFNRFLYAVETVISVRRVWVGILTDDMRSLVLRLFLFEVPDGMLIVRSIVAHEVTRRVLSLSFLEWVVFCLGFLAGHILSRARHNEVILNFLLDYAFLNVLLVVSLEQDPVIKVNNDLRVELRKSNRSFGPHKHVLFVFIEVITHHPVSTVLFNVLFSLVGWSGSNLLNNFNLLACFSGMSRLFDFLLYFFYLRLVSGKTGSETFLDLVSSFILNLGVDDHVTLVSVVSDVLGEHFGD